MFNINAYTRTQRQEALDAWKSVEKTATAFELSQDSYVQTWLTNVYGEQR